MSPVKLDKAKPTPEQVSESIKRELASYAATHKNIVQIGMRMTSLATQLGLDNELAKDRRIAHAFLVGYRLGTDQE